MALGDCLARADSTDTHVYSFLQSNFTLNSLNFCDFACSLLTKVLNHLIRTLKEPGHLDQRFSVVFSGRLHFLDLMVCNRCSNQQGRIQGFEKLAHS